MYKFAIIETVIVAFAVPTSAFGQRGSFQARPSIEPPA